MTKKEEKSFNIENEPLYLDLCEYSQVPKAFVFERMIYSVKELGFRWHSIMKGGSPTKNKLSEFYNTDLYMYDLVRYQLSLKALGVHDEIISQTKSICESIDRPKILEFGGGCGVFSSYCPYRVYYYDLEGPSRDFFKFRLKKHKFDAVVMSPSATPLKLQWDIVMVMDVLEHIPEKDCKSVIDLLHKNAKYVFCNVSVPFTDLYPMHIYSFEKYFLSKFKLISGNLYEPRIID